MLPLTNLLQKEGFLWRHEATTVFNKLKEAVSTAPVLTLPNFTQHFVLETDASNLGVGAVLSQFEPPIALLSKKLCPLAQKQYANVRELRATIEALAKFRHYLLGHKFVIRTDHRSLKELLDQTPQTLGQQAWLHKFIGFDFTIEYKSGKDNATADALSRLCLLALSEPRHQFLDDLRQALLAGHALSIVMQQCCDCTCLDPNYRMQDGLLFWQHRLVIP